MIPKRKKKKYIRENILYHHPTLPMGEFAIGTNTTGIPGGERIWYRGETSDFDRRKGRTKLCGGVTIQ